MKKMSKFPNINNICRCCHTQGTLKSLNDSYIHDGHEEIYLNMLQQAFNIDIKPAPEVSAAFSICEVCVPRLCDAFLFHRQIMSCEQSFYQYYNTHLKGVFCNKEIKKEVDETLNEMKKESQFNQNQDSSDQKFDDDTFSDKGDDDQPLSTLRSQSGQDTSWTLPAASSPARANTSAFMPIIEQVYDESIEELEDTNTECNISPNCHLENKTLYIVLKDIKHNDPESVIGSSSKLLLDIQKPGPSSLTPRSVDPLSSVNAINYGFGTEDRAVSSIPNESLNSSLASDILTPTTSKKDDTTLTNKISSTQEYTNLNKDSCVKNVEIKTLPQVSRDPSEFSAIPTSKETRKSTRSSDVGNKRPKHEQDWMTIKKQRLCNTTEANVSKCNAKEAGSKEPSCCRLNCIKDVPEDLRKDIFTKFWNTGSHVKQCQIVAKYVVQENKKLPKNFKIRRLHVLKYFLPLSTADDETKLQKVCRSLFLSTFDINKDFVYNALTKYYNNDYGRKEARSMKPGCTNCRLNCKKIFTEDLRKDIFTKFWSTGSFVKKWQIIAKYVFKINLKTSVSRDVRIRKLKHVSQYNLPLNVTDDNAELHKVCQTMFLNTLDVNKTFVYTALKKSETNDFGDITDGRGRHRKRKTVTKNDRKRSVVNNDNSNYDEASSSTKSLDSLLIPKLEPIEELENTADQKNPDSPIVSSSKLVSDIQKFDPLSMTPRSVGPLLSASNHDLDTKEYAVSFISNESLNGADKFSTPMTLQNDTKLKNISFTQENINPVTDSFDKNIEIKLEPELSFVPAAFTSVPIPNVTSNSKTNYDIEKKLPKLEPDWVIIEGERLNNAGEVYLTKKGVENERRSMKSSCSNCRFKCYKKISEDQRIKIFLNYWHTGSLVKQWQIITKYVFKESKKHLRYTLKYHLPLNTVDDSAQLQKVCKTMFLNTLDTSKDVVYTALKKYHSNDWANIINETDEHKKHEIITNEMKRSVIDHANSDNETSLSTNLDSLLVPKMELIEELEDTTNQKYNESINLQSCHDTDSPIVSSKMVSDIQKIDPLSFVSRSVDPLTSVNASYYDLDTKEFAVPLISYGSLNSLQGANNLIPTTSKENDTTLAYNISSTQDIVNPFMDSFDKNVEIKLEPELSFVPAFTSVSTPKVTRSSKKNSNVEKIYPKQDWVNKKKKPISSLEEVYIAKRCNEKEVRHMKGSCRNCRFNCSEKISERLRRDIFLKYWNIGSQVKQWQIIANYVFKKSAKVSPALNVTNRRLFTIMYHLPLNTANITSGNTKVQKVCKTMFLNTFDIHKDVVYTALRKYKSKIFGDSADDNGKKGNGKETKRMKTGCVNCRFKCHEKVNEDLRKQMFSKFWSAGSHVKQWEIIAKYVFQENEKNSTSLKVALRKLHPIQYHLPVDIDDDTVLQKVCRTMFLNTFDISKKIVYNALKHCHNNGLGHDRSKLKIIIGNEKKQSAIDDADSHYNESCSSEKYIDLSIKIEPIDD